jgi:hypothetical protein
MGSSYSCVTKYVKLYDLINKILRVGKSGMCDSRISKLLYPYPVKLVVNEKDDK